MLDLFAVQNSVMLLISIVLFIAKVVALVDCVSRPEARFRQVDTLPKRSWLILLVLALLTHLVQWYPLGILNLLGTVAALVYLAQVRSAR